MELIYYMELAVVICCYIIDLSKSGIPVLGWTAVIYGSYHLSKNGALEFIRRPIQLSTC
jgi:hypothetical protein